MSTTESADTIIEVSRLHKVFYTEDVETRALSDVNLSVSTGDYVAIVGSSGSGKTTLLAILGLLDTPSSGDYFLGGTLVSQTKEDDLARIRNETIGFIFQTFNLLGDISVFENVELPLVYRGISRKERRERVEWALERVQMGHRSRHMPGQLSGGQQQRVAIARALVGTPTLLLADEPTGNLDIANGELIMNLFSEIHESGSTICMVTHDLQFAHRASRRIRLSDGRIVEEPS